KIDLPIVKGDVDKLNRLFTNLIINAIKFSKQKGTITVHYDFTTRNKNQHFLIVEVQDTGVGIPKKDLAEIFSKYKQAENRDKISDKGTGLGLAICKMIVESHNGKISVKSEVGLGTSFFVELPIEEIP
ncbi:MAG: ATP-binding protein, partial [Calditrichaeota bacterium]|nr:ATP-binding protein [Calditrichota bacterium]